MRRVAAAGLVVSALLISALSAPGQEASPAGWPPVIAALEGEWEGTGTLFGDAAAFTMEWTPVLGGRFMRLRFTNAFVRDGDVTPVLEAEAFYRLEDDASLAGHWFDTRGVIITLRGVVEDDALVADWSAEGIEDGRTTYRVVDATTVEVTDLVQTPDGWNEFGRAIYRRRR